MSGITSDNTLRQSGLIKASAAGGGAWNFISKLTASGSGTLSFTSGLDSTYGVYLITTKNIHPSTEGADSYHFLWNGSTDGGSNYNANKTTTFYRAYQNEAGSVTNLVYWDGFDLPSQTTFSILNSMVGNASDENSAAFIYIFNPSSTTFVKPFLTYGVNNIFAEYDVSDISAGYFNTTSAINALQFKMTSGNIDTGDICLYGITP